MPKKSGFTLVEMLIVIAIIAILATIGFVIYNGAQKSARDARRKLEIDAIYKALELSRTAGGYQPLSNTQFGNNNIPVDPAGFIYCLNTTAGVADAVFTDKKACPISPAGWVSTQTANTPAANTAQWKVCTPLETQSTSFCKSNAQ